MRTWKEWMLSWIYPLRYDTFVQYIKRTDISVRVRQEYFYNHCHQFSQQIQSDRENLYFMSDLLTKE